MTSQFLPIRKLCLLAVLLTAACSPSSQQIDHQIEKSTETPEPTRHPVQSTLTPTARDQEISPAGGNMFTITIVYDNYPYQAGMETDWGFSAWITAGERNLLFDTGANRNILLRNLEDQGIEPSSIQRVILSHEHGDHTGGLDGLLSAGADPVLYLPPSFSNEFKKRYRNRLEVIEVSPGLEIFENFYSLGEMQGPPPEQSLVINTSQGLVLITGCAHPGVEKILRSAKAQFGKEIYLVLGGFHLRDADSAHMEQIIEDFRQIGVRFVAPCHCTGEDQINAFRNAFGGDFIQVGVGKVIEIEF